MHPIVAKLEVRPSQSLMFRQLSFKFFYDVKIEGVSNCWGRLWHYSCNVLSFISEQTISPIILENVHLHLLQMPLGTVG